MTVVLKCGGGESMTAAEMSSKYKGVEHSRNPLPAELL